MYNHYELLHHLEQDGKETGDQEEKGLKKSRDMPLLQYVKGDEWRGFYGVMKT